MKPAEPGSVWNFLKPLGAEMSFTSWTSADPSVQTQLIRDLRFTVSLRGL
ncbi:MAG TPA: hypothetical protein VLK59_14395 [Solirubrobacteraceae bacterium]|nr:hypothetical protein [Solirubrobacteraceae bacterium]